MFRVRTDRVGIGRTRICFIQRKFMRTFTHGFNTGADSRPLRSATRRLAAGIAVLALGWPLPALADCVDTRKPTAGEMDFHSRAMAALVAALPPVPVGGMLQNKDSVTALGQQCAGATGDFRLEASRFYEHNYRKSIVSVSINATRLPAGDAGLSAAYGPASPKSSAGLKVINVVWRVSGSDSPLRKALVDAIDRARLEAMVGKPLPSVAESQALAAQAVPATVAGPTAAAPAAGAAAQAPNAPSQPAANPSAPAGSGQAGGSEPVKDTVDTVNRLRGLFGR
jgi:hypothetical protein